MPLSELGKTPWVDSALGPLVPAIEHKLGPGFVPKFSQSGKRREFEEFGCGHYGCAMPTGDRAVVLKATTDPTEAWLASWLAHAQKRCREDALEDDCAPTAGIVRYLAVYATAKKKGRSKIFLIWREEAQDVGGIYSWGRYAEFMGRKPSMVYSDYEVRSLTESMAWLSAYNITAAVLRNRIVTKVKPEEYAALLEEARRPRNAERAWAWAMEKLSEDPMSTAGRVAISRIGDNLPKGDRAFALACGIAVCQQAVEMMENTNGLSRVGSTLAWLFEEGILLADLHQGNLGRRLGGAWNDVIITDPGHAFPIRADFERRVIDELDED